MIVPNTAHYTPPEMARRVAELGLRPLLDAGLYPAQIRVLDPACGDGALLLAALDILVSHAEVHGYGERDPIVRLWGPGEKLSRAELEERIACNCLAGADCDEAAIEATKAGFLARGIVVDTLPEFRVCDSIFEDWSTNPPWIAGGPPNCIIMNPPYLGGGKISGALGAEYPKRLKEIHPGSHGNADLAAHFLRLASRIADSVATIGIVATNTIAQGDTRLTGLKHLVTEDGWSIHEAYRDEPWPGKAKVIVSLVGLSRVPNPWDAFVVEKSTPSPKSKPFDSARRIRRIARWQKRGLGTNARIVHARRYGMLPTRDYVTRTCKADHLFELELLWLQSYAYERAEPVCATCHSPMYERYIDQCTDCYDASKTKPKQTSLFGDP